MEPGEMGQTKRLSDEQRRFIADFDKVLEYARTTWGDRCRDILTEAVNDSEDPHGYLEEQFHKATTAA